MMKQSRNLRSCKYRTPTGNTWKLPSMAKLKNLATSSEKGSNKQQLEANLHGHIKELENKLQERDADKEQLETTVCGQIKEMNEVRGKDSDREILEFKFPHKIRELREKIQRTSTRKGRNSPSVAKGSITRGSSKKVHQRTSQSSSLWHD